MKLPLFVSKRKELTAARKTQVFCLKEIKAMFPLKLSVQGNDTRNYRENKSVFQSPPGNVRSITTTGKHRKHYSIMKNV